MNKELLYYLSKKPELYAPSTSKFWDDEHISIGMLEAHLAPDLEAATRRQEFVQRSAAWIASIADPKKRPKLLDLGCGPGIYGEFFAMAGFQVTGVDLSGRSIQYAIDHAAKNQLDITYHCQNYLTIDYDQEFDIITLIYCDFGVLSYEDRILLLSKIHRALKPGGIFLFDAWTPWQYAQEKETSSFSYNYGGFWSPKPYVCLSSFYRYDVFHTILDQYVIVEEDNLQCYNIWNHCFTSEEIQQDLSKVGFHYFEYFENVAGDPISDESKTICAIAVK
ncbi:MAG: Methyltransferase type 11 [Herbinix sp.]|jgi:2-polyprenyl-3-methyl-5-hydroxy-6-metoxy-1,4-benzoquinol methylase|nr:Methyltransferase type 11 [Herbinix sp.]